MQHTQHQPLVVTLLLAMTALFTPQHETDYYAEWQGGVVEVWAPESYPLGKIILHAGHDCLDGCRYGTDLSHAARRFVQAGYEVYGM